MYEDENGGRLIYGTRLAIQSGPWVPASAGMTGDIAGITGVWPVPEGVEAIFMAIADGPARVTYEDENGGRLIYGTRLAIQSGPWVPASAGMTGGNRGDDVFVGEPERGLAAVAALVFLAAATGAWLVATELAVALQDVPALLAVLAGAGGWMVAVPVGPRHGHGCEVPCVY